MGDFRRKNPGVGDGGCVAGVMLVGGREGLTVDLEVVEELNSSGEGRHLAGVAVAVTFRVVGSSGWGGSLEPDNTLIFTLPNPNPTPTSNHHLLPSPHPKYTAPSPPQPLSHPSRSLPPHPATTFPQPLPFLFESFTLAKTPPHRILICGADSCLDTIKNNRRFLLCIDLWGNRRRKRVLCSQNLWEKKHSFTRKDYIDAIHWYTKAINDPPSDATILSNRSLCWARLHEGSRALSDVEACVTLGPDWAKAYYRKGVAWRLLKNLPIAAEAFSEALKLDPENKELQVTFGEAVQAEFGVALNRDIAIIRM
ncbi:hypothetical protein Acr_23g0019550 [Actinidia rufa]|uniref:Stress-inducible protein n=1 Tax=Actinidia rufa TaxID=165716 RepID=A0A7J0GRX0_9ERIC|nr:hypothetical protein Acr_23g0019550 [Actinidia rufa]